MQQVIDKAKQIEVLARAILSNESTIQRLKDSEGDPLTSGLLEVNDIEFSVTGVGTIVGNKITLLENENIAKKAEIDRICDDIKLLV